MKIRELIALLDAKIICGESMIDEVVDGAFSSDLMSDVLTLDAENIVLLTGLANIQTIRTAEMADIRVIVFVRGKKITKDLHELATENGVMLLESDFSMYKASGTLYQAGLKPVY